VQDSHVELQSFCIILESIFTFGFKKPTWKPFTAASDFAPWLFIRGIQSKKVASGVSVIEGLSEIKSPRGRLRAWFRLALVQRRMAEFFQEALKAAQTKAVRSQFYTEHSLFYHEEGEIIASLLVALNAVNFALCFRGTSFDVQCAPVIPFGRYIREDAERRSQMLSLMGHKLEELTS
jgi:hypothetical protein